MTRVGVYDEILPEPSGNPSGSALGISFGLKQYFIVYPSSRHNTVTASAETNTPWHQEHRAQDVVEMYLQKGVKKIYTLETIIINQQKWHLKIVQAELAEGIPVMEIDSKLQTANSQMLAKMTMT